MTITSYPEFSPSSPDVAILNLSRLFTRLEHNLLSPSADLKSLRRSEYQRMRIGANVDYARTLLTQLERSLPHLKPLDRRHELQTDLTRKHQTLKLLQDVLDKSAADAELRRVVDAEYVSESESDEAEEILLDEETTGSADTEMEIETRTPEIATSYAGTRDISSDELGEERSPATITAAAPPATAPSSSPPATVRHRHQKHPIAPTSTTATATATATATGFSPATVTSASASKLDATEETLSLHRAEQEDLTGSLLSLASQLKASSQAFQSSLEAEKSVLARATEGLDRTTTNMDAAEKRMGMLRRMTEGKGWWGRMMLYAWIFGLWLVAVLIVFLGPKLRF